MLGPVTEPSLTPAEFAELVHLEATRRFQPLVER